MRNSKMKRISLAVCLALMPFAAGAAGLGKLTVYSGLGEPLNAEIDIAAEKSELSSISARIAPAETYVEQGVDRPGALSAIRVELVSKANGSSVLKLSTPQPVNEPFLDMLIQLDWPTGRLLREYTTLLDPPGYGEREQAIQPMAAAPEASRTEAVPVKKNASVSSSAVARPAKKAVSQAEAALPEGDYTTRRGDTLRSIAKRIQPEDISLEQMLVGLFRANPHAFAGDNMNQLMAGKIIHAPREDELRALPQQEALQEVRVHAENWNAYRSNLAGTVAKSAPAEGEAPRQAESGKITALAEDKAAPAAPGPRDVVKLSKSEVPAAGAGAQEGKGAVADDKMRTLEEESIAQDKAIKEVGERIAFFEKQIQDMQQLLLVQNQILADLQKGDKAAAPAAEAPPAAAAQPSVPTQAAPAPAQQAKPATPPKPAAEETAEPSPLDSLREDPLLLGGAGGLLLLLGGAWLYMRGKRRKGLDSFEQGILTTGGLKSDTVLAVAGATESQGTGFLSAAHHAGEGLIDTSDVDPISEAEVYMAYGRDAQAEEILKDAMAKEPKRYELHHKLLEVYASRKDVAAFDTLAGEMYAALGTTSPHWHKVAELGRTLEPGNPMYAAVPLAAEDLPPAVTEVLALPEEAPAETAAPDDNSLDFDLGMLAAEESQDETAGESEKLDADLSAFELVVPASEASADMSGPSTYAMEEVEFASALELPEPAVSDNVQLEAADLGLEIEEPGLEIEEPVSPEGLEPALELPSIAASEASGDLDFVAAEPLEQPVVEPETEEELSEISFDLPELAALEADIAASTAQPETLEVDLEPVALPTVEPIAEDTLASPAFVEETSATEASVAEAPAEAVSLEMPGAVSAAAEMPGEVEEIVIEQPVAEAGGLDFDFDIDMEPAASPEPASEAPAQTLPDLDLAAISLDMNEAKPEVAEAADEITLSGAESPDVDTKLDLVTAYMDMGDTEGARELLEEVRREGGPMQRERAQKMLDSLG